MNARFHWKALIIKLRSNKLEELSQFSWRHTS